MRSSITISGIEFIKYCDGQVVCHIGKDGDKVYYVLSSATTVDRGDIRDSTFRLNTMMVGMRYDRHKDWWHVCSVAGEIIYHDHLVPIPKITEFLFNCFADESDILPLVV